MAVVVLNVAEGTALGVWVRGLNLAVRQALGRLFGFTLDAFSKVTGGLGGLFGRGLSNFVSVKAL